jgi:methyltransferase-like protein/cyclopropane fatty-acyl-phospholipid synthase-like methyltransferase
MQQPTQHESAETSYDLVPYKSVPFRQTHPDRLATFATLHGLRPCPVAQARILELGCASGGNLIPLAEVFPEATFLGIDGSVRQIADGQKTIEKLGFKNIELRHQDILEFDLAPNSWDYIICHGVYSWVPDIVRQKILEICGRCLSPQGVAIVSYNVFPGWHMKTAIRDMLLYRARAFPDPAQQIAHARTLLAFLSESASVPDEPYARMLKSEHELLKKCEDYYVCHDLLEEHNQPVYFHQFCKAADENGLQYLAESEYQTMSLDYFPEPVRATLQSLSRDLVELEQYMDFLRNRLFRQTLLCRKDQTLERPAQARRLQDLCVATQTEIETNIDPENPERVAFKRGQSVIKTTNAVVKAAMTMMKNAWPACIPFLELASAATSVGKDTSTVVQGDMFSPHTQHLAETLLRCLTTGHVDLHSTPSRFITTVSQRPRTSELARHQVAEGPKVTDRKHATVTLDDFHRQALELCDGKHDRRQILERLVDRARSGRLQLHRDGQRLTDPAAVREALTPLVDQALKTFAEKALLIS